MANNQPDRDPKKEEEMSDARKLANEHMKDQHHVITEEDMAKIQVGVSGTPDAPTEEAIQNAEERIADSKADSEEDTIPGAQKSTPWDIINP